jgi:hypothetical protein
MISEISFAVENVQEDAVWKGVIEPDAKWCFPEPDSIRKRMREEFDKLSTARATKLQKHVLENFTTESAYKKFADTIYSCVATTKGESNNEVK